MIFSCLRSDAHLSVPFLPSPLRPLSGRKNRSGMTMIELVAALALFVVILGSLMTVLNTATSLWSSSRSQQHEQAAAQNISELIANDFYQAVTDSGLASNDVPETTRPTFLLSTPPTNASPEDVTLVLAFARHASPQTFTAEGVVADPKLRVSLDAVFYTFYNNTLFRHVIPLKYTSFAEPEPLGELLHDLRAAVESKTVHDEFLAALLDPSQEPSAKWTCVVLAQRVELVVQAALPEAYVRKQDNAFDREPTEAAAGAGFALPPTYDRLTSDVLPDQLDLALHLFSEADWSTWQRLKNDTSDDATRKKQHLGVLLSKRIAFPTKGGSRLP